VRPIVTPARLAALAAALVVGPAALSGQPLAPAEFGAGWVESGAASWAPGFASEAGTLDAAGPWTGSPAVPVLASAVVPGLGQGLQGRWVTTAAFALLEGVGWWLHLDAASDADRFRAAYRDLAWTAARGSPTPRVDGPFEYYERMIRWTRSGAWDLNPDLPGLQPETATDAFNGRQWRLAAEIFLGGDVAAAPDTPGYASALEYYRDRAYDDALLWDWTGQSAAQQRFAEWIDESDAASRRASLVAGALVANHLLSAIEVFVNQRLGRRAVELEAGPGSRPNGGVAMLRVRVPGV
jgi:hypothetical protein